MIKLQNGKCTPVVTIKYNSGFKVSLTWLIVIKLKKPRSQTKNDQIRFTHHSSLNRNFCTKNLLLAALRPLISLDFSKFYIYTPTTSDRSPIYSGVFLYLLQTRRYPLALSLFFQPRPASLGFQLVFLLRYWVFFVNITHQARAWSYIALRAFCFARDFARGQSRSKLTAPATSSRTMYRSRRLFFWKVIGSLTPSLLLSAKSHARPTYSVASALATVRYRYQLFAGSNSPHHMASLLLPVDTRLSLDAICVPGSAFFFCLFTRVYGGHLFRQHFSHWDPKLLRNERFGIFYFIRQYK